MWSWGSRKCKVCSKCWFISIFSKEDGSTGKNSKFNEDDSNSDGTVDKFTSEEKAVMVNNSKNFFKKFFFTIQEQ